MLKILLVLSLVREFKYLLDHSKVTLRVCHIRVHNHLARVAAAFAGDTRHKGLAGAARTSRRPVQFEPWVGVHCASTYCPLHLFPNTLFCRKGHIYLVCVILTSCIMEGLDLTQQPRSRVQTVRMLHPKPDPNMEEKYLAKHKAILKMSLY